MEEINTPSIAAALVHSNQRFRKECLAIVPASVEACTKRMHVINNLKGKETEATIVPQAHWRPYHSEKVVGGTGGLTARTLETFPLEILEEFDPEGFYTTHFDTPFDAQKDKLDIVRQLLQAEMKNASRGLCDLIFKGVRVATGTGALDGFNGFDTIIANEIEAGNISIDNGNFLNIGELSSLNIGDRWKMMYSRLDEDLKGDDQKKLVLVCSFNERDMYNNWYAMKFGTGNFPGTPNQKYLDGTSDKVEILPLPGMNGTNHCFITTEEMMKVGFDVFSKHTKFEVRIPDNPNLVQVHAKIYMGVEFSNIDKKYLMVAARTVKDDSVFMTADKGKVTFADTVSNATKTAKVKFYGFNMTEATTLTLEGTNAAKFSLSANSISADDANATAGKEITITFTPGATGSFAAALRVTNATDNVSMVIPLAGKGVSA